MSDKPSCESCLFLRRQSCVRFPPQVRTSEGYPLAAWPAVEWADWCGEWKANPEYRRREIRKRVENTYFLPDEL